MKTNLIHFQGGYATTVIRAVIASTRIVLISDGEADVYRI
ncbi:hypothetical protein SAMN05660909_04159 [Chitinophaga terrae (ex Kim and Jung 2007)]|uniref:Uncharacterized protein n=1 Tax=Chitinophaga terrae (ex Kim and Jung 2007) TaxID=408074 RepID=A0A1H4F470_9BACT|nr:hypothetical protein [Chitinophaga terrae (ex Kim and Jung 2007)]SEA92125.1 hypothetical protein SAMN05660909_04159 [Chitinophaga terrae (ex Kim and Jung 2007)]